MKAVQFNVAIPRYVFGKAVGKISPSLLWSGLSCTYMKDIPEPELLGDEWVKIKTIYGGICGTDLSTIYLDTSTYYEPFSSGPFTIGHENLGVVVEAGENSGFDVGQRVTANPFLSCASRGYANDDRCENCKNGEVNLCDHYAEGDLAPGIILGACKDTGGSWSAYYQAHKNNLYLVPEGVSNENALMVEPFAVGLHGVVIDFPSDDETILIIGAGTIGLMQLAALRALGSKARIIITARYGFQAEAAKKLGADEVIQGEDVYEGVAQRTGAKLYKPIIGKRVMVGGADRTYECVGKDSTLDDAMRLTRSAGKVILVGVPGLAKGVDWTAIFSKELQVKASQGYNNAEMWQGKKWESFELTLHLMKTGKLDIGWMVTHQYAIKDFKKALKAQSQKGKLKSIKSVFVFEE